MARTKKAELARTSPRDRNNLPSRGRIAGHWAGNEWIFGEFHWGQDELGAAECWACGKGPDVQRCHVVPAAHGGSNEVDNLVILCRSCHADSEHLPEQTFWAWMRAVRERRWKTPLEHSIAKFEAVGWPIEKMLARAGEVGTAAALNEVRATLGLEQKEMAR